MCGRAVRVPSGQSTLYSAFDFSCLLHAEVFDGVLKDADAFVELIYGNEFAGAMGHADVSGAKDDGLRAEIDQARRFGTERDRARFFARGCLKKLYQKR